MRYIFLLGLFYTSFLLQSQLEKAPVDFFPRDCPMVVVVNNMQKLLDDLGREELIEKYSWRYRNVSKKIRKAFIYNLLSPSELQKVGIDLQKPAGFVVLSQSPELVGFFCTISSEQKLRSYLEKIEKNHFLDFVYKRESEQATIIYEENNPDGCLVIHRKNLFLIAGDGFPSEGLEDVKYCIRLRKDESLADDIRFQKTLKGAGFKSDVAVYINLYPLISNGLDEMRQEYLWSLDLQMPQNSSRYLASLEQSQDRQAEIEYWRYIVAKEKEWFKNRKEQEYLFPAEFLQSINGVLLGFEVNQKSIQLKCHINLEQDSPVYEILQSPKGFSYLLRQLKKPPLMALQCAINPQKLLDHLQNNIEANQNLAEIRAELWRTLEIELEKLLAVFDGEIALAVTGDLDSSLRQNECWDKVNLTILARLANSEKAKEILWEIFEQTKGDEIIRDGDTIVVSGERDLYIRIHKNYLVISSDHDIFQNMTGGKVKSFVTSYKDSSVKNFFHARAYLMLLANIQGIVTWILAEEGSLKGLSRRNAKKKIKMLEKLGMTGVACKRKKYGLSFEGIQIIKTRSVREFVISMVDSLLRK